jgi:hypothetical protein
MRVVAVVLALIGGFGVVVTMGAYVLSSATLSFARLYGFSACQAASGLALSTAAAVVLLPLTLALA